MSWENYREAYRTRLGNPTAKEVLALLVDEANADGLAFVGLDRIVFLTEVKKRTVFRVLQVFELIGLVNRTEALLKGKLVPAFQIDLAKLGSDLRDAYAESYAAAQRKPFGKCRSDTAANVAATSKSVAATLLSVAATQPPDPLIGGPFVVPLLSPTPVVPASGDESARNLALDRAMEQASRALNMPEEQRRKRKLIRGAIKRAAEKGGRPEVIALELVAAVQMQDEEHLRGRVKFKFGLQKFLGEGIWRDRNRWMWDVEAMRLQAEARVGSR